jgi:hypothetical protein
MTPYVGCGKLISEISNRSRVTVAGRKDGHTRHSHKGVSPLNNHIYGVRFKNTLTLDLAGVAGL